MGPSISCTGLSGWPVDTRPGWQRFLGHVPFVSFSKILLQVLFSTLLGLCPHSWCQTASTGALLGEVLDPAGRVIVGASVEAKNIENAVSRSTLSDDKGQFVLPLLPPGSYEVIVTRSGFSQVQSTLVAVPVTESIRVSIPMKGAGINQTIEVLANVSQLQSDSVALGRVVDNRTIEALPLVSRNFTQIVDLSPGVLSGVNNAGELGAGSGSVSRVSGGTLWDGRFRCAVVEAGAWQLAAMLLIGVLYLAPNLLNFALAFTDRSLYARHWRAEHDPRRPPTEGAA